MKKIFLFLAIASAFSLASCKKDRTCTCTTTSTTSAGVATTEPADVTIINHSTKGDARLICQFSATTSTNGNGTKNATTCTLK
jgi:uncharacterized phosphosugar-binding protein